MTKDIILLKYKRKGLCARQSQGYDYASFGVPMERFSLLQLLLVLAISTLCEATVPRGQIPSPTLSVQTSSPAVFKECQGINNCATWTFFNKKGVGRWPTGEEAVLEATEMSNNQITISRTDVTGGKAGLTGTYTGSLVGDEVGGTFTSTYQGKTETGHWYWIVTPNVKSDIVSLPAALQVCDVERCLPYRLENDGHYRNYTNLPYQRDEVRTLEVKSFTRGSVEFTETDTGTFPLTAVWSGHISQADNTVAEGTYYFSSWAGRTVQHPESKPFTIKWGAGMAAVTPPQLASSGTQAPAITMGDVIQGARNLKDAIELWQFFSALFL